MIGPDRAMYGTASSGGSFGHGVIFRMKRRDVETLHSFGGDVDGDHPGPLLTIDRDGVLYGVTLLGGPENAGTIFSLSPPLPDRRRWRKRVLHSFAGGINGEQPVGGLVMTSDGELIGMTAYGGEYGRGTVFSLHPPAPGYRRWKHKVIYSFTGTDDGRSPRSAPLWAPDGNIYGTTEYGGTSNQGVVFKLSPPAPGTLQWKHSLIHAFNGLNGHGPKAGLTRAPDGKMYGTTYYGGASGKGTVFSLSLPAAVHAAPELGHTNWTQRVLYNFSGGADGGFVQGGVFITDDGALYGATFGGGTSGAGTVFKLTPGVSWKHELLHTFIGRTGAVGGPEAEPIVGPNGVLYGTTLWGGTKRSGTIYKVMQ